MDKIELGHLLKHISYKEKEIKEIQEKEAMVFFELNQLLEELYKEFNTDLAIVKADENIN
jgi:hypothetical protein